MTNANPGNLLVEVGNNNVFEDLGFTSEVAVNLKIRSDLILSLRQYIQNRGWTLGQAAQFFDQTSDRIDDLLKGEIDKFTIEQLITLLSKAGLQVQVEVIPLVASR